MIYLLDTDTLIFMIRGLKSGQRQQVRRKQAEKLVERCREAQSKGDVVGVSAITVSELEYGARNSNNYEDEIKAVHKILLPFQTFDYDTITCPMNYGSIRQELETKGEDIGAMDLLIAAHALSLDAQLVTNNISHFRRVSGLKLVNWS